MDIEGIVFPQEQEWRNTPEAVWFPAILGEEQVSCYISRLALVDYFHSVDTVAQALENFSTHRDRIEALAASLISADRFDDAGAIFIKHADCTKFHL